MIWRSLTTNLRSKRTLLALGAVFAALLASAGAWRLLTLPALDPANPALTLSDVERRVASTIHAQESTTTEVAHAIQTGKVVLFDVRTQAEFEQSHIPGAILVDPDTSAADFVARHGTALVGKTPVFYCAVGVRSAILAARVKPALGQSTQFAPLNMRGGIFRWFADGRAVVTPSNTPAQSVHPYDESWKKLLDRTLDSSRASKS
jgi:rhodanese-related sulfurtransferase